MDQLGPVRAATIERLDIAEEQQQGSPTDRR
jgi:hypothetical protein